MVYEKDNSIITEKIKYTTDDLLTMPRPRSSRIPMDRQRRAKQFAAFQALKGFGTSIREEGRFLVMKKTQSEFARSDLDEKIQALCQPGQSSILHSTKAVKVTYYLESQQKPGFGTYLDIYGVPHLVPHLKILQMEGIDIPFSDIFAIEIMDDENTKNGI
ncbi:MAG: hypothetical protein Q4E53_12570 [Eubacteriales bacterium]|nr:hypothetical protein [Eubacteriales bacterium]